jgi:RNA polymerase sigma factor (sigma-70 family)
VEATVERQRTFEDFYRAERAKVLRSIVFTIDDRDLAAEVTDEAFARAFGRWSEVGRMASPSGWVYRVALNLARNRFRRLRLERRRPQASPESIVATVDDPALAAALAKLPVDQRSVVVLRFHLDWSVDEVAAALDIAPGTVKSRLHRALHRLAIDLEDLR